MTPLDRVLELLRGRGKVSRHADGRGWEAQCPAHDDRRPSLGVSAGADGRVLLHCGAGCPPEAVTAALGLTMADLFPRPDGGGPERPRARVAACYDYRDEAGVLLYQCVRLDPKDFRQRRPGVPRPRNEARDDWEWSLKGVPLVLYRLPELLAAPADAPVYVVEGEKDVDALRALGLTATCNPMGAGKWRRQFNEALRGRRVVVLPDNDQAGGDHAAAVAAALQGVAASVAVVELPGLPPKGDVSDWIAAGGTAVKLAELTGPAPAPKPFPDPIPASRLVRADPAQSWLWNGYLARGEITLFSALWKAGKTTLMAHLLKTFGAGGDFCGRTVRPARVLYVTEESESRWAQRRDELGLEDHLEFLVRPFASRARPEEWESLISHVRGLADARNYDLIVCDTLANLWPVKDENDASRVQEALMPLHRLVARAALLLVHHTRKSDGQEATAARGSGALSAFVDTIVELRRYNAGDRKDRRRVLTGYGRHDETPDEVVVELGEAGYEAHGDRRDASCADLSAVIDSLLPKEAPGKTTDQIIADWPQDTIPARQKLLDALRRGAETGRWLRDGSGKSGHPFLYWKPPAMSVSVPPLYRDGTETDISPSPAPSANGHTANGHGNAVPDGLWDEGPGQNGHA